LKILTLFDLKSKRVLIRVDFNVPIQNEKVADDFRVRAALPTIKHCLNEGASIVLISHLGRPEGQINPAMSLMPVGETLAGLLEMPIKFSDNCVSSDAKDVSLGLKPGEVHLLENLRFHDDETKNDKHFSYLLSKHGEIYINDAFGTAHRAHASTEGVTKFLKPSVAVFLLQKELDYLQGAVEEPKRPFAAIVGGSKVSSKISVIESMLSKVDKLILGGGMVFTFLKARGYSVGSSLVEDDQLELATKLEAIAKEKGVELVLASDVTVADAFAADANTQVVPIDAIPDGWMGLDIGPTSITEVQNCLADCKTVIWNGPMGVFEMPAFAKGTFTVAETLANMNDCITIIGGGDSVAAVEQAGLADKMSHISTGGGASLELLEGKVLPGVAALSSK
jgi:phosphoglycerate kinase